MCLALKTHPLRLFNSGRPEQAFYALPRPVRLQPILQRVVHPGLPTLTAAFECLDDVGIHS
jgi:hypothetical protein